MRMMYASIQFIVSAIFVTLAGADTLRLADGTVLENVFVRDDLMQFTVWDDASAIGCEPTRVVKLDEVSNPQTALTISRDPSVWQAPAALIDWQIITLELQPLPPSFVGMVELDENARPVPRYEPTKMLRDIGDEILERPTKALFGVRPHFWDGQKYNALMTLRNYGTVSAPPCPFAWYLNGRFLQRGAFQTSTQPGEKREALAKLIWREGYNVLESVLECEGEERNVTNNKLSIALWSRGFNLYVTKDRAEAWRTYRSPAGTHGLEGYIQWHLDAVNDLLDQSRYESAPYGSRTRVRLNRVIYADLIKENVPYIDGEPISWLDRRGYADAEGRLIWNETPQEVRSGQFEPGDGGPWAIEPRLSLPLLRSILWQLGLPDYRILAADSQPSHDPTHGILTDGSVRKLDELSVLHLNRSERRPSGYRGELYFGLPKSIVLRFSDQNGKPLSNIDVNLYQRGVVVKPGSQAATENGARYWPVKYSKLDDKSGRSKISSEPVIQARTNDQGEIELPNRSAAFVRTFTNYERQPNPFGEIDPLGWRGVFQIKLSNGSEYRITAADLALLWQRGEQERAVLELGGQLQGSSN